jgi:molybdopterin/thiamine biosynthesis adenylyltransferase
MFQTSSGRRLLACRLFLARDGVDYVPGKRGYRMLTADFVRETALACSEEGLAYLAIHCHGGTSKVAFSGDDMASHVRGYPALLDILNGPPVGGLVFAEAAVASDIWIGGGQRIQLVSVDVVGRLTQRLFASPLPRPPHSNSNYDRQARLFGDRGQEILKHQKIAVVGAGGAGSLIVEQLSRLGVGKIVVIDPERIDPTNLPRVVGSHRRDTRPWLTHERLPQWIKEHTELLRTSKVKIARRVAVQANPNIQFVGIEEDIADPSAVEEILDADYVFLAADSMQARLIINALVHQYLIPGVQVGAKVQIDRQTGDVIDVFTVVRPLIPGQTCLWCNNLINPTRLAEEAANPEQRKRQRYVEEVPAPSVITLNAVAASQAVNDYLFAVTGLSQVDHRRWNKYFSITGEHVEETPRRDSGCRHCQVRLAAGPHIRLPTKITRP